MNFSLIYWIFWTQICSCNTYLLYVVALDQILFGGKQVLPSRKKVLLSGKQILPSGEHVLPSHKKVLLSGKHVLPSDKQVLLSGKHDLPSGEQALPCGKQVLPNGKLVLPSGEQVLPSRMVFQRRNLTERQFTAVTSEWEDFRFRQMFFRPMAHQAFRILEEIIAQTTSEEKIIEKLSGEISYVICKSITVGIA